MWSNSHDLLIFYILSTYALLVAGRPPTPPPSKAVHHLPLTWSPFGFLSDIEVGTPKQKITCFIDWTWVSQVFFSTFCQGIPDNIYNCVPRDQQIFNQTLSKTFKNASDVHASRTWNPNHFFFDKDYTAMFGSDILTVGPSSSRAMLQVADMQFESEYSYPFGGIYGLSPVFPRNNGMSLCSSNTGGGELATAAPHILPIARR